MVFMMCKLWLGIDAVVLINTEDTRETMFSFQRLSIALQKGNATTFQSAFDTE